MQIKKMTGRQKQLWLFALIKKRVKKEKTIMEIYEQFQNSLKRENIPFSVFRYSIQVLINEKFIEAEKRKIKNGSKGLTYIIKPVNKKTNDTDKNNISSVTIGG